MTTPDDVPLASGEDLYDLSGSEGVFVTQEQMRELGERVSTFRRRYKFALEEVLTKISILREEWDSGPERGPIMHVKSRLKSFESLVAKMNRLQLGPDLDLVAGTIRDIAGVRVTCPYVEDVYKVADTLRRQSDLEVLALKDYIESPKPNGYRSLHLIVTVPVFLASRTEFVPVEIQIRTIAQDFWASVEHEMRYKYDGDLPREVSESLDLAARTAVALDAQMTHLRRDVLGPS